MLASIITPIAPLVLAASISVFGCLAIYARPWKMKIIWSALGEASFAASVVYVFINSPTLGLVEIFSAVLVIFFMYSFMCTVFAKN